MANRTTPSPAAYTSRPPEALGQSEAFLDFQERLSAVAPVERPVLLLGERGTGKELAAARLHFLSGRWGEALVTLNCAALAPTLIEAELFGHEAGAFTGAARARPGRFEAADGGTLFLDELGNIPRQAQEKILRAVEYGCFERVGSSAAVAVDVRLVGATHADLPALAAAGRFMRDLLDRLSFEVLRLPPLRERAGDVPLLAAHFAARMAHELGRSAPPDFSPDALAALEAHPWPGNVRELKNVVERAVYRCPADTVETIVFDPFVEAGAAADAPAPPAPAGQTAAPPEPPAPGPSLATPLKDQVRALETDLLRAALREARHNQRRAAEILGLTYHQFRGLYRKHRNAVDG
jgi:psp operon transcriptional activator